MLKYPIADFGRLVLRSYPLPRPQETRKNTRLPVIQLKSNASARLMVTLFAIVIYTVTDIAATPLFNFGGKVTYNMYFLLWQLELAGLIGLILIMFRSIGIPIAMLAIAYGGAEDFLYYALQFQYPPATLPWITSPLVLQPATPISLVVGLVWGFILLIVVSVYRI